ncbi:MAG: UDP-3-O-(3-hydroxymyristoyl)glucosamine N-acyltransferase [candidate division Zixibacteria bacterium RBG_16_43_9]|nr:MAG: UDP-3-O-(3-hydroxymyristoyl)glucosamine N-acyltransferase [candidate division Zixibacteria bacterium RBG_16_43_9]
MEKTLEEIASLISGELIGDGSIRIKGIAGIEEAEPGELSFLANPVYRAYLEKTRASAVIVGREIDKAKIPLIRHNNPYYAFCKALEIFTIKKDLPEGIHKSAILGKDVRIGKGVHIGPYVIIGDRVQIEDRVTILAGSFIGDDSVLGEESFLYPRVTIREESLIGKRVILHPGAVIGSDGFGYAREGGVYHKIPQVGKVVLEDDVEIGANTTIDRATLGETRIGKGTKIDNLVQIGHNVSIGENTVLAAQVGISGSTRVGKNVVMGGQVGLGGHIKIGDNVMLGAQAGATKSIPSNTIVSGYPAREHTKAKKIEACITLLPFYVKKIRELEKRIKDLEKKV